MRWAVEVLYPALPIAFERGLGPRKVDELGRLQSAYQNFCVDRLGALIQAGRPSSIPVFGDVAQATDLDARRLDEWVGAAFRPLFIDALAVHDAANFAEAGVEAFRHSLDGRVGELFGLAAAETGSSCRTAARPWNRKVHPCSCRVGTRNSGASRTGCCGRPCSRPSVRPGATKG